jgi:hypothetical protein
MMRTNFNGEHLPLFLVANDAAYSIKKESNSTESRSKLTLDELERLLAESAVEGVFGLVVPSEQAAIAALNKRNAEFWSRGGR